MRGDKSFTVNPYAHDDGDGHNNRQQQEEDGLYNPEIERFELGDDVYSLIFISPVRTFPFFFGICAFLLKVILYSFLAYDLYLQSGGGAFGSKDPLIRATQFFLIPVAVAMQEDLIHVYTRIANIRYDPQIQEQSPAATEFKFALSFMLRYVDGLYSLIINFVLLLITDDGLSLFLNFAALGFLQSIDDVAFHLAANGYVGDNMEDKCALVRTIDLPKRVGDRFTNSLDSILFLATYAVMLAIYIYVIISEDF